MKRSLLLGAAAATFVLLAPPAARAQTSLGLGLGIVDPEDVDTTLWTTINLRLPLGRRLFLEPEVGFWKSSEEFGNSEASLQDLNLGGNVILDLGGSGDLSFWLGAGLGAHVLKAEVEIGDTEVESESDTKLGIHLLGGFDYDLDRDLGLFAAARYDIVDTDGEDNFNQAKVYGGLRVRF